jgi:hypothetical protein
VTQRHARQRYAGSKIDVSELFRSLVLLILINNSNVKNLKHFSVIFMIQARTATDTRPKDPIKAFKLTISGQVFAIDFTSPFGLTELAKGQ